MPLFCRNWSIYGIVDEIQMDSYFYSHETCMRAVEEDYHKIKSAHRIIMDASWWELLARFPLEDFFRTKVIPIR
jgi:hypothetical protein